MNDENIVNNETLKNPDAVKVVRSKKMYAIFDRARMAYLSPMEKPNNKTALRDFEIICKQQGGLVAQMPEDFAFYYLGYIDEETGEMVSEKAKLAEATEFTKAEINE